jgi:hypothetical protein
MTTNTSPLQKVISGGQTGTDQADLIAVTRFGIATGGWMPRGFQTADGPNLQLAERYGLREHTGGNVRPQSRTAKSWGIEEFAVEFLCYVFRALGHEELPHLPDSTS